MKEKLYVELRKRCQQYGIKEDKVFTALSLATALGASRNSISQYLNEYVKEGKVIKITSRPVYFYDRKTVELTFDTHLDTCEFESFDTLFKWVKKVEHGFQTLIGYDNSLQSVVEQCKAGMTYPSKGLPILLYGPTGSGKSLIARLMYEFALQHDQLSKAKRFVSVNCSEYANNPELVSANLFGHVKGAYTGADEDNKGLIALADGGVLFLDEVHSLSAECQEKLFFFMDKGMYHQIGDNENWYTSTCRVIFATSENPQAVLLKTLLRRIPILVTIPSLKERPLIEKKNLIYTIFNQEAIALQKQIEISNIVYQTFMDYEFTGNIGALKNAIKATCALAFLNQNKQKDKLEIHIYDVPDYILESFPTIQFKGANDNAVTMIPLQKLNDPVTFSSPLLKLYERIVDCYEEYFQSNHSFDSLVHQVKHIMEDFNDYLMYKNRYRKNANEDYMLKMVDKIYSLIMNKYSLAVSNSEIQVYSTLLCEYAKFVVDAKVWVYSRSESVHQMLQVISENAPREFIIAKEIVANARFNLDLVLDDVILAILTFAFIDNKRRTSSTSVGVIVCHGYSTASSIADAVNRMLQGYVFDGIDMELNVDTNKIIKQLDTYLKYKESMDELFLLVDMGSLEEIHKKITPLVHCNIGLINNVSTKLALEVGSGLQQGKPVKMILDQINTSYQLASHYIEGNENKLAILSICATGFGAAKKISELLLHSFPKKIPIEIIPYEYQALIENGVKDTIFSKYKVVLIVGTLDPKMPGYPFIPVESLVLSDGMDQVEKLVSTYLNQEEIETLRRNITKNFTLSNIVNHLTILNAEKVIEDVEEIVKELEDKLHVTLELSQKTGLFVHLSCLIERLILKNEIEYVDGLEAKLDEHQTFVEVMRAAFHSAAMRYSVELPDAEIIFILNYFENV